MGSLLSHCQHSLKLQGMGSTLLQTDPPNPNKKGITMEIQGMTNDDNSELRIIVKLDSPVEFAAFNHFFQEMIECMAKECGATAFDAVEGKFIGDNESTEEEILETLSGHAEKLVSQSNREVDKSLRLDFL